MRSDVRRDRATIQYLERLPMFELPCLALPARQRALRLLAVVTLLIALLAGLATRPGAGCTG